MAHTTDNKSPTEEADAILAARPAILRRLSHNYRCAAFWLLERGYPQALVARMFGVSRVTARNLANAYINDRYPRVKLEYERLGEQAFGERYFTEYHRMKLREVRLESRTSFGGSKSSETA